MWLFRFKKDVREHVRTMHVQYIQRIQGMCCMYKILRGSEFCETQFHRVVQVPWYQTCYQIKMTFKFSLFFHDKYLRNSF